MKRKEEKKVKKKIFWLNSFFRQIEMDYAPDIVDFTDWIINGELDILISRNKLFRHIPEGYDAYILHLSDTSEEAIKELRENQPWSWIYGITGAVGSEKNEIRNIFKDNLDRVYDTFDIDRFTAENIFNEIKDYRRISENEK